MKRDVCPSAPGRVFRRDRKTRQRTVILAKDKPSYLPLAYVCQPSLSRYRRARYVHFDRTHRGAIGELIYVTRTVPMCSAAHAHRRKFVKLRVVVLQARGASGLNPYTEERSRGRRRKGREGKGREEKRERERVGWAFNSRYHAKNDLERRTELIYGSAVSDISSSEVDNF